MYIGRLLQETFLKLGKCKGWERERRLSEFSEPKNENETKMRSNTSSKIKMISTIKSKLSSL